jgi:hypothetical protein
MTLLYKRQLWRKNKMHVFTSLVIEYPFCYLLNSSLLVVLVVNLMSCQVIFIYLDFVRPFSLFSLLILQATSHWKILYNVSKMPGIFFCQHYCVDV